MDIKTNKKTIKTGINQADNLTRGVPTASHGDHSSFSSPVQRANPHSRLGEGGYS